MLPVTCPSGVLSLPAPPTWQTLGVPTPQVPPPLWSSTMCPADSGGQLGGDRERRRHSPMGLKSGNAPCGQAAPAETAFPMRADHAPFTRCRPEASSRQARF